MMHKELLSHGYWLVKLNSPCAKSLNKSDHFSQKHFLLRPVHAALHTVAVTITLGRHKMSIA